MAAKQPPKNVKVLAILRLLRVSEEELDKFKQAARLEAYASYSEFVRRTALIEAAKIIKKNKNEGIGFDECN